MKRRAVEIGIAGLIRVLVLVIITSMIYTSASSISNNLNPYNPYKKTSKRIISVDVISNKIEGSKYLDPFQMVSFVKNLSPHRSHDPNIENYTIVVEGEELAILSYYHVFSCMYSPINLKGIIIQERQDYLTKIEPTKRKILIVPQNAVYGKRYLLARLEEAALWKNTPDKDRPIREAIDCMKRIFIVNMCKSYLESLQIPVLLPEKELSPFSKCTKELKITEKKLRRLGMSDTIINKLFLIDEIYNERKCILYLFSNGIYNPEIEDSTFRQVWDLHGLTVWNRYKELSDLTKLFESNNRTIIKQIRSKEKFYETCPFSDIRNAIHEDIVMFANILTEGAIDVYNLTYMNEILDRSELWNRKALELMFESLINFIDNTDELSIARDRLRSDMQLIIKELESVQRETCFKRSKDIIALTKVYMGDYYRIQNLLTSSTKNLWKTQHTPQEREESIRIEHEEVLIAVLKNIETMHTNNSILPEKEIIIEEKKEKILSILDEIGAIVAMSSDIRRSHKIVQRKRKDISSILAIPELLDPEYQATRSVKGRLMAYLSAVIDLMISRRVSTVGYVLTPSIQREIDRQTEYVLSLDHKSILDSCLEFYKTYCHKQSEEYSIHLDEGIDIVEGCFLWMERNSTDGVPSHWILRAMRNRKLSDAYIVYSLLHSVWTHITLLAAYDQIWEHPVSLFIEVNRKSIFKKRKPIAYITYRKKDEEKEYKIEINLTEENLQSFVNARTFQDIQNLRKHKEDTPSKEKKSIWKKFKSLSIMPGTSQDP